MSEKAKEAPIKEASWVKSLPLGGLISALMAIVGVAMGSGWAGVIAMAAAGLGVGVGYNSLVGIINKRADARDVTNAGADAGETSVDIAQQASEVKNDLDDLQREHPPLPPSK